MSRVKLPTIDSRKATLLAQSLRRMVPHYTPEWPAKDEDDPGVALLNIFAFLADGVIQRLNRAPELNFLCFLDMLGIRLLPETPSIVPVRFLAATGTTASILVSKGAQVSAAATDQHPELPFETTQDLLVVPSSIIALFAVDPAQDIILKPPPGFLALKTAAPSNAVYSVAAFCSIGSDALQLDRVDQLQKGDFLLVKSTLTGTSAGCCGASGESAPAAAPEYYIVKDIQGRIVQVTKPLVRDYTEGVQVERIGCFDLCQGVNFQQHILYLAHADLFNVKSEAQFELAVELATGEASNLQPLRLAWEFYGATETNKQEGWHALTVELDGTAGFSADGRLLLTKPAGEIKESEIYQKKNRWIRARLIDRLPATPTPALPRVESVALRVSSAGTALAADLAFNNDTPLAINLPFYPFGVEPRTFDRFYLASKEAFSKSGADVLVTADLDYTDLLASPTAAFQPFQDGPDLLRVFAHGAAGRLVEFRIDPAGGAVSPAFVNHLKPGDTRITASTIPAAVLSADEIRVGVFVRADDHHLYLRHLVKTDATASQWIDLGRPKEVEPEFNPAAVLDQGGLWQVFTVAGGKVYSRTVVPSNGTALSEWTAMPKDPTPKDPTVAATPFVINSKRILATDKEGSLWQFLNDKWQILNDKVAAKGCRPFAISLGRAPYRLHQEKGATLPELDKPTDPPEVLIFLRDPNNQLICLKDGVNLVESLPPLDSPLDSDPSAVPIRGGGIRVYGRCKDNRLRYIEFRVSAKESRWVPSAWVSTVVLSETTPVGDPFPISGTIARKNPFLSLLSATNQNSVIELRRDADLESGRLQAGPHDLLILHNPEMMFGRQMYIRIVEGPGSGDIRRISSPVSQASTLALLDEPLQQVSTQDTRYELFEQSTQGHVIEAKENSLILDGAVTLDQYVLTAGQLQQITSVEHVGQTWKATFGQAWNPPPSDQAYYVLARTTTESLAAGADASKLVVLSSGASSTNEVYTGRSITIAPTDPEQGEWHTIRRYRGNTKLTEVSDAFAPLPAKGWLYWISSTEAWRQYQDPDQTELRPELSWEYWNGAGWVTLRVTDTTKQLLFPGEIKFTVPANLSKTEVAGQDNYWVRARIVGGDYGREMYKLDPTNKLQSTKDSIRPPLIKVLGITYSFSQDLAPQACLTFNNLSYLDQTAANKTLDKYFSPFEPLHDTRRAVYFGFDQTFTGGPVRLYAVAKELSTSAGTMPKFSWTVAVENNQWKTVPVDDDTSAFTKPELITWTIPSKPQKQESFGETLYWVRATLEEGSWNESPVLTGLFPNTTMARQARTLRNEILGSSDGTASQAFRFAQPPVLDGQEIRVREVLTDEERERLLAGAGTDAILEIKDAAGVVRERWVLWQEVNEFFGSNATSRHYRLDHASGELLFGDGVYGKIPPAGGDNVRAFAYQQTKGGAAGNVQAGEITSLVSSVAGVDSVINPVAAGGGSERTTAEQMLEFGPAQISNRGRAVTPEDFEWLAKEASREVRKARCVPNRNDQGRSEPGWVSIFIVPDSTESEPRPSLELRRAVTRYLAQRADLNLVAQDHIWVGPPNYVAVGVEVTVFARTIDDTGQAERNARAKLDQFLHPLTGGRDGTGWEFGRDLAVSDIYQQLEAIEEVDHLGRVVLHFNGQISAERAEVGANGLIANGTHLLTISVA